MIKDTLDILRENLSKFFQSAETIYKTNDFTSATILYFKTLFACIDLMIFDKIGIIPKDHSERFRILKKEDKRLYSILDEIYPMYRDTYTSIINKKECDRIREHVKRIIKK